MNNAPLWKLIAVLFDLSARDDERDDAAMDLGQYNNDTALGALVCAASDPRQEEMVLDSCGESIASILVERNNFRKDLFDGLNETAKRSAISYIEANKPEWKFD